MKQDFIEKIYAGWLAKIIGIRLGAPVESWTYEKIRTVYGEVNGYLADYRDFAADDDSNGPIFLIRALEDCGKTEEEAITPQDVAEALLNYAPYEHGFFWWGGYGVSTEHTAYLNLRHGITAPRSGSARQNGRTAAEQIGGQIFIDSWGLAAPGNPALAASLARKAASVTHDGNGVYGGIFVAVCISYAFVEKDIVKIIRKGLSFLPEDCEYAETVKAVMAFWEKEKNGWRLCFQYIFNNFGYDKYPGVCHIIPNIAVMILALLYGKGDFSDTINICTMCGWDTDCNVGNVAAIMGVRGGLNVIDSRKWRQPVHDFLACSSVIGSLNIMDIPYGASYIARQAYKLAGEEVPMPWKQIFEERMDSCHFEYPGSTHAIRMKVCNMDDGSVSQREGTLLNTIETAFSGSRSLKCVIKPVARGEKVMVYKKTYCRPADFHDSRYDPAFSPLIYPGQTLHAAVRVNGEEYGVKACLYVHGDNGSRYYYGSWKEITPGCWEALSWTIPGLDGELLDEAGVCFLTRTAEEGDDFCCYLDDLYWDGTSSYGIDFASERVEVWPGLHREISQFTKLKGRLTLEQGRLHLSCSDFGEAYTGGWNWTDYMAEGFLTAHTGEIHLLQVRVQGALRSYAFGLIPEGRVGLLKNDNGYRLLCEAYFPWEKEKEYRLAVRVKGNHMMAAIDGKVLLEYEDTDNPYLYGCIGTAVREGSHCSLRKIWVGSGE